MLVPVGRSLVAFASLLCLAGQDVAAEEGNVLASSWKQLEAEVRAELPAEFREDSLAKTKAFQRLTTSRNPLLWNSLIEESESDLLALLGFVCIVKAEPDRAFEAAVHTVRRVRQPANSALAPVYKVLREHRWAIKDLQMLRSGMPDDRIALIVVGIPVNVLSEWLSSPDVESAPANLVAYSLDQILSEPGADVLGKPKASLPEATKVELLKALAECPGIPRCVYLKHAELGAGDASAMRSVLIDESIPDIQVGLVVRKRAKMIEEMMPRLQDSLSEKRLALVQKGLARYREKSGRR